MNCYQKFYANQIHSSSLLCQLATMWKSQVLCDAIIKSGPISIKAHRVVLVAACPMLQSMENASIGSHLEVRVASDIKRESIYTFLQYLYEGFMLLTEENCKDVEKIGRLLQVDSVIKCCGDFLKCLSERTGSIDLSEQYRYSNFRDIEFRHVRSSDMHKNGPERSSKRVMDGTMPYNPSSKRQRHVADDALTMTQIYGSSDHGDRLPFLGAVPGSKSQGGTVQDSLELVEKDPPGTVNLESGNLTNRSVSIAVASEMNTDSDIQVVNVETPSNKRLDDLGSIDRQSPQGRNLPTTIPRVLNEKQSTVPSSVHSPQPPDGTSSKRKQQSSPIHHPQTSTPHAPSQKPFAAGSAAQSRSEPTMAASPSSASAQRRSETDTGQSSSTSTTVTNVGDMAVVKIESDDSNTGGLDMYVDTPEDGIIKLTRNDDDTMEESEVTDQSLDWSRDRGEGGAEGDTSWFPGQQQETAQQKRCLVTLQDRTTIHTLMRMNTKNRTCAYCGLIRNRTTSGFARKSYFKCNVCDVWLCGKENCFDHYHDLVQKHGGRPVTRKTYSDLMKKKKLVPGNDSIPFIVARFDT